MYQGWHPRGSAHADPRPRFYAFFRDFQNWSYADPRADTRICVVRAVRVIRARIRADVDGHDYQSTLDIFSNFLLSVDQNSNFIVKFYEYQLTSNKILVKFKNTSLIDRTLLKYLILVFINQNTCVERCDSA